MTKSEALIYEILGSVRPDVRPLACTVDTVAEMLFIERIPMSDIFITKDIYPTVAKRLKKSRSAVSRAVERLAYLCWETISGKGETLKYIGKPLPNVRPSEMIFYLAYYLQFRAPFYQVIQKETAPLS